MTPGLARRRRSLAPLAVAVLAALAPSASAAAPVNVTPPRVAGSAIEGERLRGDEGIWSGTVLRLSRRWQRDEGGWVDVGEGGAYDLGAADVGHRLRLKVSALGLGVTVSAVSAPTAIIEPRVVITPTPTPTPTPAPTETATPAPVLAPPAALPAPELIAFPQAAFPGGLPAITVRWGERPAITGELVRPDGRPVADARLWVTSRLEMRGAVPMTLGWVTTNALGRFAYTPPPGASRALTFAFADSAALRTSQVTIRVRPRITLRFTRGGLIAGRVAGAPFGSQPRAELQSRVGPMWRTFATTRLSAIDGTFAARPRTTRRRVRVLIRAAPSWPFETGTSAAVTRGR